MPRVCLSRQAGNGRRRRRHLGFKAVALGHQPLVKVWDARQPRHIQLGREAGGGGRGELAEGARGRRLMRMGVLAALPTGPQWVAPAVTAPCGSRQSAAGGAAAREHAQQTLVIADPGLSRAAAEIMRTSFSWKTYMSATATPTTPPACGVRGVRGKPAICRSKRPPSPTHPIQKFLKYSK